MSFDVFYLLSRFWLDDLYRVLPPFHLLAGTFYYGFLGCCGLFWWLPWAVFGWLCAAIVRTNALRLHSGLVFV